MIFFIGFLLFFLKKETFKMKFVLANYVILYVYCICMRGVRGKVEIFYSIVTGN